MKRTMILCGALTALVGCVTETVASDWDVDTVASASAGQSLKVQCITLASGGYESVSAPDHVYVAHVTSWNEDDHDVEVDTKVAEWALSVTKVTGGSDSGDSGYDGDEHGRVTLSEDDFHAGGISQLRVDCGTDGYYYFR